MCKKYLVLLLTLAIMTPLFADIILHQTFDSTDVIIPQAPTGWAIYDSGPNGKTWATSTSHPRSTPNCIRYNYSITDPANDWFFSKSLSLTAGITYSLEFFYRGSNPFFTEKLEVYLDNNQTPPASGAQIFNKNNIINTIYQQGLVDFTVPSTGTYYLGFHCYSAANQWNLRIDDITVYKNVHDVGVDIIYSPIPGTYNNTTVFKPKFLVRNYGQNTGGEVNVPVWCAFVRYPNYPTLTPAETLDLCYKEIPRLEICNPETVWCDSWIPQLPCNHKFLAWTALQGDQDPANDKKEVLFAVDFRDVQPLKIVIPQDTMVWCSESIPTDTVVNNGHQTESFWTYFKSLNNLAQQEYLDSSYVTNLAPQEKRRVTFKPWHFPACNHTAITWTALASDENHSNDTITKPYVIKYYDFEVVNILNMPDTAQVCNTYYPRVVVHNNGQHTGPQSATVFMNMYRNGILINSYQLSSRSLMPCQSDTIEFPWHADSACNHQIKAWVMAQDQNPVNDTAWKSFVVKYYDVEAVSIVNVPDTVAVCNDVTAKVVVHNKGIHVGPQQGWVYFYLYRSEEGPVDPVNPYVLIKKDSVLKTLTPCVYDTASFTFHADSASNHRIIAKVVYPFDQDHTNDSVIKDFVIKYYDWELIPPIVGMPDTTQVCTWLYPEVLVHNNGMHTYAESARVYMDVYRNGVFYNRSSYGVFLAPCQSSWIEFSWHADSACNHEVKFYVVPKISGHDANPNNDTLKKNFVVKYYDVEAVSIVNVPDTVTVCNDVTAKVVVHNKGIHVGPQEGWVYFYLYRNVSGPGDAINPFVLIKKDSVQKTLTPCVYDTVPFTFHADSACNHRIVAKVVYPFDQDHTNDSVMKDFVIKYYDVSADSILGVPDTIQLCTTIYDTVVIRNRGIHTGLQTGKVYVNYIRNAVVLKSDSATVSDLAAGARTTVPFSYHPDSSCNWSIKAWVKFTPDLNPANDTVRKNFVVKYIDAEIVSIIAPDTVQVCDSFDVTVRVHNDGEHHILQPGWWVYCQIGIPGDKNYGIDSLMVNVPLLPCETANLTFRKHIGEPCNHIIDAWLIYPGDQNPANNSKTRPIVARFTDAEVTMITAPDTVQVCNPFDVTVKVHNNGQHTVLAPGWYTHLLIIPEPIEKGGAKTVIAIHESLPVMVPLAYCETTSVVFEDIHILEPCDHIIYAWTALAGDQNRHNDTMMRPIVAKFYDFEVVRLTNIPDTIEQCNWFYPTVVIHNNGVHTEPQPSIIKLQVYRNGLPYGSLLQQQMAPLEPCHLDSFTFEIHADSACSHEIVAWVEAPIDQNHSNDTLKNNYVVTYHDVGVVAIAPIGINDTLEYCNNIAPQVTIHNYGIHTGSVNGELNVTIYRTQGGNPETIETTYVQPVLNLRPCVDSVITLAPYHPDTSFHRIVATVNFKPDQISANNTKEDTFIVRYRDVAVGNILIPGKPSDTVVTCNSFNPTVEVYNNGSHVGPVPCTVRVKIWRYKTKLDSLCSISPDTLQQIVEYDTFKVVTLDPGLNIVTLPSCHLCWWDVFLVGAHHRISVTISSPGDQNLTNNYTWKKFIVKGKNNDLQVNYVGLLKNSVIVVPEGESLKVGYAYNPVSAVSNTTPTASFRTWFKIVRDNDGNIVFSRYLDKILNPWTYACLYYQSGWVPSNIGWYTITSWLQFRPGVDLCSLNNSMSKKYYVKPTSTPPDKGNIEGSVIGLPTIFAIHQNAPNPFKGMTNISWQIPIEGNVTISVYDASGRIIKTLVNENRTPGYYRTTWNCTDANNQKVSAGVYFYEMRTNNYTSRLKMVIAH